MNHLLPSSDVLCSLHDPSLAAQAKPAERGTLWVAGISALMMVVEIVAGWWFNSMALLADGWHMSSHVVAIGLAAWAYRSARKLHGDPRFAFGTWKLEVLGGFASAVLLVGVGAIMVFDSIARLVQPGPIDYRDAMIVAAIGLVVNLVCAWILGSSHTHDHHGHGPAAHDAHHHADRHDHAHEQHDHDQDHEHGHDHHEGVPEKHHDLNLRAAYTHVLADAATSVLAIVALLAGLLWGWRWMDPLAGLFGAVMIVAWSRRLIAETATVLLDREMDHPLVQRVGEHLAHLQAGHRGDFSIRDLHLWRVGRERYACILCIQTQSSEITPALIKNELAVFPELAHLTVEVQHGHAPLPLL